MVFLNLSQLVAEVIMTYILACIDLLRLFSESQFSLNHGFCLRVSLFPYIARFNFVEYGQNLLLSRHLIDQGSKQGPRANKHYSSAMGSIKFACVVLLMCMVVASAPMARAITCGQVARFLSPCMSYLRSSSRAPSVGCCRGVSSLNRAARTTAARRSTCNCLKSIAASKSSVNYSNAASLPGRCRVRTPYTISPSTDCNRISELFGAVLCNSELFLPQEKLENVVCLIGSIESINPFGL
ncbi:hypothetical protein VNO78_25549 [Psophocarpus tetragonolobus]|uniref:Non-specific lipid-transfer protein n=1 Tax=Psophocarpus tetragonolobus TaxID=3891 RepID=A0AAN9S648_PSOTE